MKNVIQKNAYRNLLTITCLSFLLSIGSGFTPATTETLDPCPSFSVTLSEKESSSITFDLYKNENGGVYTVRYIRNGSQYSNGYTISGSSHKFENLPSGNYRFIFTSFCMYGSNFIIIDDIII